MVLELDLIQFLLEKFILFLESTILGFQTLHEDLYRQKQQVRWMEQLDETILSIQTGLETVGLSSVGSGKNLRMFSRKPDVDYCKRLRQAKSKIDGRGEFVGFYSPSNRRPTQKAQNPPDVRTFELKEQKSTRGQHKIEFEDEYVTPNAKKSTREALRPLMESNIANPDSFHQGPRKQRGQRPRRSKQNLALRNQQYRKSESFEHIHREFNVLQHNFQVVQEENGLLKTQNQMLKNKISELSQTLEQYQYVVAQHLKKSMDLQEQRDIGWCEVNKLKEQIQRYERYNSHMKDSLDNIENISRHQNQIIDMFKKQKIELREQLQIARYSFGIQKKSLQQQINSLEVQLRTYRKLRFDAQIKKKSIQQNKKLMDANKRLRMSTLDLRERLAQLQNRHKDELFELSPEKQT